MLLGQRRTQCHCAVILLLMSLFCRVAVADDGGILVQASEGKLVTGSDRESGGQPTIGDRAFTLSFPSPLLSDIPSFLSLANPPTESDPLPIGSDLFWDFLPMTHNGVSSNLLYWNGNGTSIEDVEFGLLPQNDITFSLYTDDNFSDVALVDGSPKMIPGKLVGTITNNTIALHAHRWFYLASESTVPEGIYLAALQLRMEGFENSDPFYIIAGTDEIPASTLDGIALPWVEQNVDTLIVPGDFDFDGDVDGSDFLTWQRNPSVGSLDAWQTNYGGPAPNVVDTKPVPEPASAILLILSFAVGAILNRRGDALCSADAPHRG